MELVVSSWGTKAKARARLLPSVLGEEGDNILLQQPRCVCLTKHAYARYYCKAKST